MCGGAKRSCVAVCCSVLQCVAVCVGLVLCVVALRGLVFSVLQCVAVCCNSRALLQKRPII